MQAVGIRRTHTFAGIDSNTNVKCKICVCFFTKDVGMLNSIYLRNIEELLHHHHLYTDSVTFNRILCAHYFGMVLRKKLSVENSLMSYK